MLGEGVAIGETVADLIDRPTCRNVSGYQDTFKSADKYDEEFYFLGWHFHFWGNDSDEAPRYGTTMSRDGETWECDYDCMFGAGFDDDI